MPEVVAKGRRPEVRGCGYCHYPNGKGRPENAGIAGLPAAYIVQQMTDFKSGARTSAEPRMVPPNLMVDTARGATDVPKTAVEGGMIVPVEGAEAGMEPLGHRNIEMPKDPERAEVLRDDAASFVAYVPVGTIDRGQALVMSGGGKTIACGICHGPSLESIGSVPPLAGRSPSYTIRQLFDIQRGNRNGL